MAQRAIGAGRLLYGSDHPYMPYPFEIDKVTRYAELEDDDIEAVLGTNAAKLFGDSVGKFAQQAIHRNGQEKTAVVAGA